MHRNYHSSLSRTILSNAVVVSKLYTAATTFQNRQIMLQQCLSNSREYRRGFLVHGGPGLANLESAPAEV